MKTLNKVEAKKLILISFLFIFSINLFANGNGVVVTTYAGTGFAGSHDGDALTEATFGLPVGIGGLGMGICFDNEGNLLVADAGNNKIRKISPTGVVTTIAGAGIGYLDGPANIARFNFLADIAVDSIGNIYIADGNNNRIRKLDTAGIVSTFAGSGVCSHVDGIGTAASFCTPTGVEMDNEGNILVADLNNSAIRKITPAGVVTTVKVVSAGAPVQVAVDKEGNIFFTVFSNRVFKIDTNGVETLIAGGSPGFADDTGAAAMFNLPWGIALDNDGNIYIGDQKNHRVRKIDTNNVVTTLAGTGVAGFKDGPADSAQFNHPAGLCHDASGSIFVADQNNHRIRKIAVPIEEEVTIEGTIFTDYDTSNSLTIGDTVVGGIFVKLTHTTGSFYIKNKIDGSYTFNGPSGNYDVTVVENSNIQQTVPFTTRHLILTTGAISIANNFFLVPTCEGEIDISVNYEDLRSSPCPGVQMEYCFTFHNTGTDNHEPSRSIFEGISIDIPNAFFDLIGPAKIIGPNCNLVPSPVSIFGGTYTFKSVASLAPDAVCEICQDVIVKSTVIAGDPVEVRATWVGHCDFHIAPFEIGGFFFEQESKILRADCAIDPNDKQTVFPKGCGILNMIQKNQELTYQVRFQNTGTAPALRVEIRDTLDADLNLNTIQLLPSSHTITDFKILPHNIMVIVFDNINLPDSTTTTEGSKGFIRFKITPQSGLADSTTITNSAAIIFDSNPPVLTNTVLNTLFDNRNPVADFSVERQCQQNAFDFTYTGGSQITKAFWRFEPDGIPGTSDNVNPEGVTFVTPGGKRILLFVENDEGCFSSLVDSIVVKDVTCGNGKILVCHNPPGNASNAHTICINESALYAHFAHGDCLGECPVAKTGPDSLPINTNENLFKDFFNIYPNPFLNETEISFAFESESSEILTINLNNHLGEKVMSLYEGHINSTELYKIKINSSNLSNGFYYCTAKIGIKQFYKKVMLLK